MSKVIQKYKCPVCNHKIKTDKFWVVEDEKTGKVKTVFNCPDCKSELTVSPELSKYFQIFIGYLGLVFFVGFGASFFTEEPVLVTNYMLIAFLPLIPILYLAIKNNKAIKNT